MRAMPFISIRLKVTTDIFIRGANGLIFFLEVVANKQAASKQACKKQAKIINFRIIGLFESDLGS